MNPRTWALATSLCLALAAPYPTGAQTPAKNPAPEKVLRYSFPVAETGFDPAQITDLYSAIVLANMLDALYEYDYLARPAKIKPNLAEAMPEVSADYRQFTVRMRKGIYFADDRAFGGRKREATAQDFVYSVKRFADPKNKSPRWSSLAEEKVLGMDELRKKAEASGKFDYDSEIAGLKALAVRDAGYEQFLVHGDGHAGSPGFAAFQSAKSTGLRLASSTSTRAPAPRLRRIRLVVRLRRTGVAEAVAATRTATVDRTIRFISNSSHVVTGNKNAQCADRRNQLCPSAASTVSSVRRASPRSERKTPCSLSLSESNMDANPGPLPP